MNQNDRVIKRIIVLTEDKEKAEAFHSVLDNSNAWVESIAVPGTVEKLVQIEVGSESRTKTKAVLYDYEGFGREECIRLRKSLKNTDSEIIVIAFGPIWHGAYPHGADHYINYPEEKEMLRQILRNNTVALVR